MSQRQLADPRYDGSFVSQIEAGRRMPSPEALSFFARKLRVSPDDLAAEVPPSTRLELEMARQEAQTAFDAGNVGAAKEAFDHLLELARGAGSADFEAEALLGIGQIEEITGEVSAALDRYREAEAAGQSDELRTRIHIALGRAHRHAGDLAYSVDVMERVLEDARAHGWTAHAVRAAVQLASTLAERGDHRRARQVLDSIEGESRLLSDARSLASLHWARSRNDAALGKTEDALLHLATARALLEQQHATLELSRLEGLRALHLIDLGRPEEAVPILEGSVRTLMASGATLEAARLQTEQARAELASGHRNRAREIAEEALETLRGLQDPLEEAQCSVVLALALGNDERAEALLRSAADRFAEHGADEQLARTLQALGELYVSSGRHAEALETFRAGLARVVTPIIS